MRYKSTAVKLYGLKKTYDSRDDECSVVHHGVTGKPFDSAIKKVVDPERHRIDQDENGQLDADQDGEKVLKKSHQKMRLKRGAGLNLTAYIRKMFFGGPTRLKVTVRYI